MWYRISRPRPEAIKKDFLWLAFLLSPLWFGTRVQGEANLQNSLSQKVQLKCPLLGEESCHFPGQK